MTCPVWGSTFSPPEYEKFASATNMDYGILALIMAFLNAGWLSIKIFILSLKDGIPIHNLPSSVILRLSGYPIRF